MTKEYLIPENFLKEIDTFLTKGEQSISFQRYKKYASPEFKQWLEERNISLAFLFYIHKNHLTKILIPTCPTCGKELSFKQIINCHKFCSTKCSNSSEIVKEKKKHVNLEKYGVECSFQAEKVKEKSKKTCLERYGVEYFAQTEESKEKYKQTCLAKYGVENPSQLKENREKAKRTCFEKYGVNHALQSKKFQEKIKQTCKEKYGVEYALQSEEFKEKQKQTKRSNHWETFCSQLKEKNIIPMFSKEEYIDDMGRKFKCSVCGEEFISEGTCNYKKEHLNKNGTYTTLNVYHIYCPHCFKARYSQKEKEIFVFLNSIYNGEIQENVKGLFSIKRMELDIFLPALNLGIEFDGDYWHSLKKVQERDTLKNQFCDENGIKLLRIKESDWDTDKEKVKEEIKFFLSNAKQ